MGFRRGGHRSDLLALVEAGRRLRPGPRPGGRRQRRHARIPPPADGFALLQALRDDPPTKTLPVILLSARAGEEAKVEGLQGGADDYLIKPFSARELLARADAHIELARVRRESEAALRASNDRFRRLFEANIFGAVFADFSGALIEANNAFVDLLGYTREELRFGRVRWDATAPPEYREADVHVVWEN